MPTIVQVLVTAALARADTGVRWVRDRAGADHLPIWGGSLAGGLDRNDEAVVVVRCAPDDSTEFAEPDLAVARSFATEALAGRVPATPTVFDNGLHLVSESSWRGPHCWLWRTGLIEMALPIGLPVDDDRPFTIPAAEVAEAVLLLAGAVHDGWYRRLFAGSRRVRLDWTLAVTQHVSTATTTAPGKPWCSRAARLETVGTMRARLPRHGS